MSKKPRGAPWIPAAIDDADVAALKAVNSGTASADQQIRAINCIIYKIARTYDQPFRSGADGDRETAFACGMQWVGQQIVKETMLVRASTTKSR